MFGSRAAYSGCISALLPCPDPNTIWYDGRKALLALASSPTHLASSDNLFPWEQQQQNGWMCVCLYFTTESSLANLISLKMNPKWHWRTPMRSENELMFKPMQSLCTQGSVRWQNVYYCTINTILGLPWPLSIIEPVNTAKRSIWKMQKQPSRLKIHVEHANRFDVMSCHLEVKLMLFWHHGSLHAL